VTISFEPGAPLPENFVPLCVPQICGNEWNYIEECLDTGWVSSVGSFVDRFEQELAAYIGTKYAVATASGTAALHIALLISGVKSNEEVLVPALTFIAPANAVRYVGAWPVFIDVEPKYWQMDPQKTTDFLEKECYWDNGKLHNKTTGRRVKAIVPVHILGHPVDMDPILEVARKYNIVVIEDATESLGAKFKGRKVGQLGDIACFSFNGNKIITTSGGGMIVTDNEVWARKARYLTTQAKDDPVEYVHNEIGYNYRLTNIQAAMGCAQLEQLPNFISTKRRLATAYSAALRKVSGITPMAEAPWAFSIYWMYTVLIEEAVCGISSRALLKCFREAKVQTRPLWQPLHLSTAHKDSQSYFCETAEKLHQEALSLPCSVGLSPENLEYVVSVLESL
jgi:perosamine synthetase